MSKTALVLLIVGGYAVSVSIIGIYASRKSTGTTSDYFLADRKIGAVLSFFTLTASFYSAYLIMGAVGFYYTHGFGMLMAVAYTAPAGFWYWVFGGPIHLLGKKYGHSTIADLLQHYYQSKTLGGLVGLLICFFIIPYLATQYTAIGMAFQMATDGAVSYQLGAIILGSIVCLYVFLGGFKSVAWTDLMQGIFFLVVVWVLGFYFLGREGGMTNLFESLISTDKSLITLPGPQGYYSWGVWFSFLAIYTALPALRPDTIQRAYAAKNLDTWRKACLHTAWALPATYVITMIISFGLRLHVPGLEGTEAEQALIAFFNIQNPIIAIVILAAAMAASMSTIDSLLLVASQYLTQDVVQRFMPGRFTDKQLLNIGKAFTVLLTVIAVLTTLRPPQFMILITALLYGIGCLIWPVLGAIAWPRGTKQGAIACIVTSCVILAVLSISGLGTYVGGIHFILWGLFASAVVYVVVSLLTPPLPDDQIEAYHGFLRRNFWNKFDVRNRRKKHQEQC